MTPRLEMIWEEILAADFSTPDGIRAFVDRARSNYTAMELTTYLDYTSEHQRECMTNGHESKFRIQWQGMADEATALIAQIRALGAGGIKSPLAETPDGGKVIDPCLFSACDITTGKPIDELYDQTIVSLRHMAARAMENNATVQDVAQMVNAARGETTAGFEGLKRTQDQVDYLAGKKKARSETAREAHKRAYVEPAIAEAKKRAADDMTRAIEKVRGSMLKNPKQTLRDVCRRVCTKFTPLTERKNAMGDFAEYAPLSDWQGKAIQPDTVAKNYRTKYGTKKSQKQKNAIKQTAT